MDDCSMCVYDTARHHLAVMAGSKRTAKELKAIIKPLRDVASINNFFFHFSFELIIKLRYPKEKGNEMLFTLIYPEY